MTVRREPFALNRQPGLPKVLLDNRVRRMSHNTAARPALMRRSLVVGQQVRLRDGVPTRTGEQDSPITPGLEPAVSQDR